MIVTLPSCSNTSSKVRAENIVLGLAVGQRTTSISSIT